MAYSYSYHDGEEIILVLQTGVANYYKEMLDWMMSVRVDPRFAGKYGILCDFREGTVQLTPTDAYTCGTILSRFFQGQKIAFVVPDALNTMVDKLALAVQSAAEVRGFSAIQAAEDWLCAAPG